MLFAGPLPVPPEPPHGLWENCSSVLPTVPPFAPDRLEIILTKQESLLHLTITQPPVPMGVIQIVGTILQEHTQRLFLPLSDQGRIDMAAADIGKTPDVGSRPFGRGLAAARQP